MMNTMVYFANISWDLVLSWLEMGLRWLHVMAGITWMGTSFYFNWFDSLVKPTEAPKIRENNRGILEEMHGGSFYYHEQFWPNAHPRDLKRHSWPAKTTFLTGLSLLVTIYWFAAASYLVDKNVLDISLATAITVSASSIAVAWFFYRGVTLLLKNERVVFWVMALFIAAASFFFLHVFGARAAFIHTGVLMGSIMGLNVWLVIVPNHIAMTSALKNGQKLNLENGAIAKRHSQHNNYFSLPVVFTMVSNHFSFLYGHSLAWYSLLLILLSGFCIRYALNIYYKTGVKSYGLYSIIISAFLLAMGLNFITTNAPLNLLNRKVSDDEAMQIVSTRCAVCHANTPNYQGFTAPPLGMVLENIEYLKKNIDKVQMRAIVAKDMPLGNLTNITEAERAELGQWIAQQKHTP